MDFEDISYIHLRMDGIDSRINEPRVGIAGFASFIGRAYLGGGTVFNTYLTTKQLEFALAFSNHPLVLSLIHDGGINPNNFSPVELIEQQVLQGIKIFDLGCGCLPTFARATRTLGAEVYTVDIISVSDMVIYDRQRVFSNAQLKVEENYHIQIDLDSIDAPRVILNRTGGNFDLITSAHLGSSTKHGDKWMKGLNDVSLR